MGSAVGIRKCGGGCARRVSSHLRLEVEHRHLVHIARLGGADLRLVLAVHERRLHRRDAQLEHCSKPALGSPLMSDCWRTVQSDHALLVAVAQELLIPSLSAAGCLAGFLYRLRRGQHSASTPSASSCITVSLNSTDVSRRAFGDAVRDHLGGSRAADDPRLLPSCRTSGWHLEAVQTTVDELVGTNSLYLLFPPSWALHLRRVLLLRFVRFARRVA